MARATASRPLGRSIRGSLRRHRLRRFAGSRGPWSLAHSVRRRPPNAGGSTGSAHGKKGRAYAHDGARPWEAGTHTPLPCPRALLSTARLLLLPVSRHRSAIARGVSGRFLCCACSRGVERAQFDRSTPLSGWSCTRDHTGKSLRTRTGSVQLGVINGEVPLLPRRECGSAVPLVCSARCAVHWRDAFTRAGWSPHAPCPSLPFQVG